MGTATALATASASTPSPAPLSRHTPVIGEITTTSSERTGRTISLHLVAGRFALARHVLELAIGERGLPGGDGQPGSGQSVNGQPDTPLANIGLSLRTVNALEVAGFRTIGDVQKARQIDLMGVRYVSVRTVQEIRMAVKRAMEAGLAE